MTNPSASIRALAQHLLAVEAGMQSTSDVPEAVRVCEKLRISLAQFAGPAGYTSLLRRALSLARAEFPALQTVKVGADGSLEGLEHLAADASNGGPDAAVAITTYLLALLVTFIGQPLTLRLVRNTWPGELLD